MLCALDINLARVAPNNWWSMACVDCAMRCERGLGSHAVRAYVCNNSCTCS